MQPLRVELRAKCSRLEKDTRSDHVKQIACGKYHTLLMTARGTMYGYGDNSKDQIMAGKEVVLSRPHVIAKARKYAPDLIRMHTNDDSSMMTVFDKKIEAPVMFQWGGKNIIESNMTQVIDGGTTLNPEGGVHIRGGS